MENSSMLKHVVALVALTIVVILFMSRIQQGLGFLVSAHDWVDDPLKQVFSPGTTGNMIRELLALLVVPVLLSLVPILAYWLGKHALFPWTLHLVWALWLVQTAAIVLLYAPVK